MRVDTIHRNRSFWWDRARCAHADVPALEAVIFDIDGTLDAEAQDGLLDLIWGLHCADIRIAITTSDRRARFEPRIRQLIGDGVVEVMVTGDDVARPKPDPEAHRRALDELGVHPANAMAVEDSAEGLRAARNAGLATVVVTTDHTRNQDFTGAAAVVHGYDGPDPLSVHRCRRLRERWWIGHQRLSA